MSDCPHHADLSPTVPKAIHKEECTVCFENYDTDNGVDVCLTCFNGSCRGDSAHSQLHFSKFSHPVILNVKRIPRLKRGDDPPPQKVTKLEIHAESEEDQFETITTLRCLACGDKVIDSPGPNVSSLVSSIKNALTSKQQSEIQAWELEVTSCTHTINLNQGPAVKLGSHAIAHCNSCDVKENLWLCLTCGNLGCGRQQYGGLGGNGHGLAHFNACKHPVSCKLGTITPEGTADIYCYECDSERLDPNLSAHLSNFGISISSQQKTEKTLVELQLDQNLAFDFSTLTEDGRNLRSLFGEGLTGLKNLGNTCYMNSVLQCLFATSSFKQRYGQPGQDHIKVCRDIPSQCFHCQMAKMCSGLLSGKYSIPIVGDDGEVRGQSGISPSMFKTLIGKGHQEFSSMRQQDAQEYLEHLFKVIEQKERAGGRDPTAAFKFPMEQRLHCTECNSVKYNKLVSNFVQLPVPAIRSAAGSEHEYEPVSLDDCLKLYSNPSVTSTEFNCPTCKRKTTLSSSTMFANFPEYLIIATNRFVMGDDYVMKKLNTFIEAPIELDLSSYVTRGRQEGDKLFPEDAQAQAKNQVDVGALDQLLAMGFSENRARKALLKTGNSGVDAAMNWLFEHLDDDDIDALETAELEVDVTVLTDMGFTMEQAQRAMKETSNDVDRAIDWLFSHADQFASGTMEVEGTPEAVASSRFKLLGFISHRGSSAHCGHYVSHIWIGGRWVLFNDNKVVEVEGIGKALGEAYVFIYKRV